MNKKIFLYDAIKNINESYKIFFENEFKKDYFFHLDKLVEQAYLNNNVYPAYENIFKAFSYFDISKTKLLILGQDPYHVKNMADGLAFSTKLNICPKSLNNIFKEIESDFGIKRTNYNLEDIAQQGVMLINTTLTVKENEAFSHKDYGWDIFVRNFLNFLSSNNKNVIYLLMGKNAYTFEDEISQYLEILKTSHPSPFSYHLSLKNSKTFKKINDILDKNNLKGIKW